LVKLPASGYEGADEALFVFAGGHFVVEAGGGKTTKDFADLRASRYAEGDEVVAGDMRTLVAGFRQVVVDAFADSAVFGERRERPQGWERERLKHFGDGAALDRWTGEIRLNGVESRYREHRLALTSGCREMAGDTGVVVLAEMPCEGRPISGAGGGEMEISQAGEGLGPIMVEAEGWVDCGQGTDIVQGEQDVFGFVLGEDAGQLVVQTGAAHRIEVTKVALEPGERLGFHLEA
jgi:hypothetical protein